ncbi:MAG TPA: TCP-1/cpn60 chaperonin family protein [Candidatus Lokiarchaeia archaeon]|nr:TCP-1/cpn60 chaperonin family protein [Candidatus Lokiarchaeia archaeon]
MSFQNFALLDKKTTASTDLAGHLRAAIAVGELFRSSLGPTGMEKLVFDRSKNHLVATADGYTLIKELGVLTEAAVPKHLLKVGELQYKLAGDFTKTTICLAAAWLRFFVDTDFTLREQRIVLRGFNRVVKACIAQMLSYATSFADLDTRVSATFAENILRQNLQAKLSPPAADHLTGLLIARIPEWVAQVPDRQLYSSFDFRPRNFHTAIAPGGHITDSYVFNGIILKKDVATSERVMLLQDARIVLTREKLYTEKPTQEQISAEYQISSPNALTEFKEHEQVVAPHLPEKLAAVGANVLITEKGISDRMRGLLEQHGIIVVRRAKLKQMVNLAKATGASLLNRTEDVSASDVGVSPAIHVEKVRGDWRAFIETAPAAAASLVIRCSSYEVGAEVRRVVKSALRATIGSLNGGKFLPGAGGWLALAVNLCNHAESAPQQARDAAAFGFFSVLQALVTNAGADPLDIPLEMVARNQEQASSYAGFSFPTRQIGSITEIGVYDALRAVQLAIDHARQFVSALLNVDQIFHFDKKPHRD